MLSKEDRDQVEQLLQQERERALEGLQEFDATRGVSLQDQSGELTLYRFHLADAPPREIRAMGGDSVEPGRLVVPKDQVPYELWNRLIGEEKGNR